VRFDFNLVQAPFLDEEDNFPNSVTIAADAQGME